ncbi:MAG: P-loop NTPase, partial [Microvirga sp.]
MAITREQVLQALATVKLGEGGASLASSGRLSEILIDPTGRVMFSIAIEPSEAAAAEPARLAAEAAVRKLPGVSGVFASLTADRPAAKGPATSPSPAPGRPAHAPSPRAQIIPGVTHVIAVASGKGGVGKSTTACNLALALLAQGLKIGVLDADIYGPSMPKLFGLHGKPRVVSGRILEPLDGYGVKVMSIGFMVEEETPMIWRGPMV